MARKIKTHTSLPAESPEHQLKYIPIDSIEPPALNMRTTIDESALEGLADSIKKIGLLQPITVVRHGDKFSIVAGYRRFLAHKLLQRHTILSRIVNLSDTASYMATWHENIFRDDTTPLDDAIYLARLFELLKITQTEMAKMLGKSQQWISQRLHILDWPQPLQDALSEKKISFSVARELSYIDDPSLLEHYLYYAIKNGITPQIAQNWRQQFNATMPPNPQQPAAENIDTEIPEYQPPQLTCQLCMKPGELQTMTHIWVHSRCLHEVLEALNEVERK